MRAAYVDEIREKEIEALRPLIQEDLSLKAWSAHDWLSVEMIMDATCIRLERMIAPPFIYSVIIMGKSLGSGLGSGNHENPITAIFRAYLTYLATTKEIKGIKLPTVQKSPS